MCARVLVLCAGVYDKVTSQVAAAGKIKGALFSSAVNAKLHKLHSGDLDDDGVVRSAVWDKLVFSKLSALFGGKVKLLVTGSAPLSNSVAEFVRVAFNASFVEGYGMTETCGVLTASARDDATYGHVGIPAVSVALKLVDLPEVSCTIAKTAVASARHTACDVNISVHSSVIVSHRHSQMGYTSADKPNPRGEIYATGPAIFAGR